MFELPVLIGDIGGTNARFALIESPDEPPRAIAHEHTDAFPDPVAAIRASLGRDGRGAVPRSMLLAVAGRVDQPVMHLTNASWTVDARAIGAALNLSRAAIVNDFVPLTAALTRLKPGDLVQIGPTPESERGHRVVLGPGTGFGASALLPFDERLTIVSTEAGHTDFGPSDAAEAELWPKVPAVEGRRTVETFLSGPGLVRLHKARTGEDRQPNEVLEAGLGGDADARATLDLFARLLGRFCGDMVLTFGATGGLYLAGGIAPRMIEVLNAGGFRAAFEAKAPFGTWMRNTATAVITAPDPALIGLTALALNPDGFVFDLQSWTAGAAA